MNSRVRSAVLAVLVLAAACGNDSTVIGTAVGLRFETTIPSVAANAALPTITVSVIDPIGTVVTSATTQITLLGTQSGTTVTVAGTLSRPAVNGVATFTGLSVAQAGSNYQLVASGAGLAAASSNTFTVTP